MHVCLDRVTHEYGRSEESAPVRVLDDVSLEIASGDFVVLMGASGSGKSTLLNLIGAIDHPTAGRVLLDGADTSRLDEATLTSLRRSSVGFVFQFFNLIPTLSVFENVAFPLELARRHRDEIERRVREVLEVVGVSARAEHFPNELSGGEMQRVAMGRAIVHQPKLILADEPTGNLDSKSGIAVLDLLRTLHQKQRSTVVMATHSDRAAAYGDYIIEVSDGKVAR